MLGRDTVDARHGGQEPDRQGRADRQPGDRSQAGRATGENSNNLSFFLSKACFESQLFFLII